MEIPWKWLSLNIWSILQKEILNQLTKISANIIFTKVDLLLTNNNSHPAFLEENSSKSS